MNSKTPKQIAGLWKRRLVFLRTLYSRLGLLGFLEELFRRGLLFSRLTRLPLGRRWMFRLYYTRNTWQDPDSRSGGGSNLEQTEIIRRELPALFNRLGIRVLLDAPCGDGTWWQHVTHDLERYVGVDVVPHVLQRSRRDARHEFHMLDIVNDPLPGADGVLCRDLFIHFSEALIFDTLRNLKKTGATYLITTTYPGRINRDIETGDFRPLDLTVPPYDFPQPIELINEGCTEAQGKLADKSLGVWRFADLPID